MADFDVRADAKILLAPLPSDLDALAAHPLLQEKLMPVLGVVRSPSVEHAIDACVLVTEHGGLGHTSAVYARDDEVSERFAQVIRTGRILVNAPTAVGALGGIYNAMTPTFSLGCGTWGGSHTTDNINYRNLLNVKAVSHRQAPPQWFRVPSDTYFNSGSLDESAPAARRAGARCHGSPVRGRRYGRGGPSLPRERSRARVRRSRALSRPEAQVRAGVEVLRRLNPDTIIAIGGGSVMDAAKGMRLFYEGPELQMRELALPFLDARKRVARYPETEHRVRLVAVPTTAGTGSEVSPAAVITVDGRKVTLVDYSLVPDIAIVEPHLTPRCRRR